MRELHDYYTVAVEQVYDQAGQTTPSGIIKLNDAYIDPEEGNRYAYKRMYGQVVSGPMMFSDEIVDAESPGYDEPKAFISGDKIQYQRTTGDANWSRANYHPGTFEGYETFKLRDYAKMMNVRPNDKMYFMETVTEPENLIGTWGVDHHLLYRCRADQVICVVRNEEIIMQGTWVLIDPVMESWEQITTKSGIIMKPKPEAKYLRGIIKHVANDDLKEGDEIFYLPDSNWGVTVEDRDYFGIRKKEIIATIKKKK